VGPEEKEGVESAVISKKSLEASDQQLITTTSTTTTINSTQYINHGTTTYIANSIESI
jgi:hypothetical protein